MTDYKQTHNKMDVDKSTEGKELELELINMWKCKKTEKKNI